MGGRGPRAQGGGGGLQTAEGGGARPTYGGIKKSHDVIAIAICDSNRGIANH